MVLYRLYQQMYLRKKNTYIGFLILRYTHTHSHIVVFK